MTKTELNKGSYQGKGRSAQEAANNLMAQQLDSGSHDQRIKEGTTETIEEKMSKAVKPFEWELYIP